MAVSDFGDSVYTPWPPTSGTQPPASAVYSDTWRLPAKFYLASALASPTDVLSDKDTDDFHWSVDGESHTTEPLVTTPKLNPEAEAFVPTTAAPPTETTLNADAPEFIPGTTYEEEEDYHGASLDPDAPEFVPGCRSVVEDDGDDSVDSLIADLASFWVQGLHPAFHEADEANAAAAADEDLPVEDGSLALLLAEIASDGNHVSEEPAVAEV
ncbi:hypothetical protein FOZ62_015587 [Perkinsus olseni]|uniref:Uncharacterized protein n=1 Tax=Perkinsus olseni TaxID=32597 RepID=A0A7J6SQF6_PEROL|nr:hypothetical protein FOZ62_015587 [Perkinsus olseni]